MWLLTISTARLPVVALPVLPTYIKGTSPGLAAAVLPSELCTQSGIDGCTAELLLLQQPTNLLGKWRKDSLAKRLRCYRDGHAAAVK